MNDLPPLDQLLAALSEAAGGLPAVANRPLPEQGFDSLDIVEWLLALEASLDLEVSDDLVERLEYESPEAIYAALRGTVDSLERDASGA